MAVEPNSTNTYQAIAVHVVRYCRGPKTPVAADVAYNVRQQSVQREV